MRQISNKLVKYYSAQLSQRLIIVAAPNFAALNIVFAQLSALNYCRDTDVCNIQLLAVNMSCDNL